MKSHHHQLGEMKSHHELKEMKSCHLQLEGMKSHHQFGKMKSHHELEKLKSHICIMSFVYGIKVDGWYSCKFFFEAYKRLAYLFVFIKQARKKDKLNKIHSPLKILDYSILVRRQLVSEPIQFLFHFLFSSWPPPTISSIHKCPSY